MMSNEIKNLILSSEFDIKSNSEILEELFIENHLNYLELFSEKNFEKLFELLESIRILKMKIKKHVDSYEDQSILWADRFVQSFNLFNKLMQNYCNEIDFSTEVNFILHNSKYTRAILIYLYKNNQAQHKMFSQDLKIPKSSFSDIINKLISINCVRSINIGKYVYYELTLEGQKYVRQNFPDEIGTNVSEFKKREYTYYIESLATKTTYYKTSEFNKIIDSISAEKKKEPFQIIIKERLLRNQPFKYDCDPEYPVRNFNIEEFSSKNANISH